MKNTQDLKFHSLWTTHIGCIKGCVDYLKLNISLPWIFGGTGHAFIMNVHEELCPSGPTAWKALMLFELAPNLGYKTDGVLSFRGGHGGCTKWTDAAQAAWDFARKKLDQNIPVYAWEMDIPEYYCIHGYDEKGYYYNGCLADAGKGPMPWQELDKKETGVIDMTAVHLGEPAPPAKVAKEAFEKALFFATNPDGFVYPKYASGLKAYDYWMKFLDGSIDYNEGHAMGIGYNGEVWAECRRYAVDFLDEAKFKVGQHAGLFDEAIKHYTEVRENLICAANIFPFHNRQLSALRDPEKRRAAVKYLGMAREAEEKGLKALEELTKVL
jgi:hypothetical protein